MSLQAAPSHSRGQLPLVDAARSTSSHLARASSDGARKWKVREPVPRERGAAQPGLHTRPTTIGEGEVKRVQWGPALVLHFPNGATGQHQHALQQEGGT